MQRRLDVRKYSISQRTSNTWNILSNDCVHASVNMFMNIIGVPWHSCSLLLKGKTEGKIDV